MFQAVFTPSVSYHSCLCWPRTKPRAALSSPSAQQWLLGDLCQSGTVHEQSCSWCLHSGVIKRSQKTFSCFSRPFKHWARRPGEDFSVGNICNPQLGWLTPSVLNKTLKLTACILEFNKILSFSLTIFHKSLNTVALNCLGNALLCWAWNKVTDQGNSQSLFDQTLLS